MACFAAALYGWFEAAAGRRVRLNLLILALALAGGLWTHYYFVLAFIPIVVGEVVRQAAQRRLDIRPWTAIVSAGLIALPLWPLVRASSAQRATFWARPDADSPLVTRTEALYHFLFETLEQPLLGTAARVVAALLVVELVCRALWGVWPRRVAVHHLAALGACLLLPVAGLLLAITSASLPSAMCSSRSSASCWRSAIGLSWLALPSGLAKIAAVVVRDRSKASTWARASSRIANRP